jgi:hypothetical protein
LVPEPTKLCAKEWYAIIKLTRMTPNLAINFCNEVHGACRHRPRFHRFDLHHSENTISSTDESVRTKESQQLSSTTSLGSTSSTWTNQSSTYVLGKSFQWDTCLLPPYH